MKNRPIALPSWLDAVWLVALAFTLAAPVCAAPTAPAQGLPPSRDEFTELKRQIDAN